MRRQLRNPPLPACVKRIAWQSFLVVPIASSILVPPDSRIHPRSLHSILVCARTRQQQIMVTTGIRAPPEPHRKVAESEREYELFK